MYTSGNPKWWWLYLGLGVLLVLFVGEIKLEVPIIEHRAFEIVIVLAAFGLTHRWLSANAVELLYRPRRKARMPRDKQTRK